MQRPGIASAPDLLALFSGELARGRVTGEANNLRLLFLAVVSRLMDRVVSVAVKGPSAGGKSFLVDTVLRFFPPSEWYALSAMSEKALAYSHEPLVNRMLVIYEAAGLRSEFASYLIRSLLSEGHLRYETVERGKSGLQPRLIERKGPTGLIVTTTAVRLHPENETRLLSLSVSDSPAQTMAVMRAEALDIASPLDYGEWHQLQEWLKVQDNRVIVPFASQLAEMVPPVSVRLRRDFPAVLGLIKAHAILHQASRERDTAGRIVARSDDYTAVRTLVADVISYGAEQTVPTAIRETVKAVAELDRLLGLGVTVTEVARVLRLDKSTTSRRCHAALDRGFLRNEESSRGRPAKLVIGEPLPDDVAVLPSPDALTQALSAASMRNGGRGPFPATSSAADASPNFMGDHS